MGRPSSVDNTVDLLVQEKLRIIYNPLKANEGQAKIVKKTTTKFEPFRDNYLKFEK